MPSNIQEEINFLLRATRHERSRFIIVQYNHYDLVRKVKTALQERYPQRKYLTYNLEQDLNSNFPQKLLQQSDTTIFVEHTQRLLSEDNRLVAIHLNQRRDAFSEKNAIVLFFLPAEVSVRDFAVAMPDIHSIVSPISRLEQLITKDNTTQNLATMIAEDHKFANSAEASAENARIRKRLTELDNRTENVPLQIQLLFQLHETERFLGEYAKAKKILEQLLNDYKAHLSLLEVNNINAHLGGLYKLMGNYVEAKNLLETALAIDSQHYPENHPIIAERQNDLAVALQALGDYFGAKALFEKAVRSAETNFGENHPTTAISYSNLALVLKDLGDYAGAKALLKKAMHSDEVNFGENHPITAIRYSNLALVLADLKEYQTAFTLMFKAYQVMIAHFEKNHPYYQGSINNLNQLVNKMLKNGYTEAQIQALMKA